MNAYQDLPLEELPPQKTDYSPGERAAFAVPFVLSLAFFGVAYAHAAGSDDWTYFRDVFYTVMAFPAGAILAGTAKPTLIGNKADASSDALKLGAGAMFGFLSYMLATAAKHPDPSIAIFIALTVISAGLSVVGMINTDKQKPPR